METRCCFRWLLRRARTPSGRVVHLGVLFILEPNERPRFELPYDGSTEEDRALCGALIHRMTAEAGDSWARSVRELSELAAGSGPATNVALDRSVVRFHSLYAFGPGGTGRKGIDRRGCRGSERFITGDSLLRLWALGLRSGLEW